MNGDKSATSPHPRWKLLTDSATLHEERGWLLHHCRQVRLWQAVRPIRCVRCHHLIRAGTLFTKGRRAGRSHGDPAPVCLECEPVLIGMNQLDYYAAVARMEAAS